MATFPISLTVNGVAVSRTVEARTLLSDFLRDELDLKGTHLGCEHGVCGTCTVLIDGQSARSCLTFAVQADGGEITTIEGLADPDGTLHPLQQAFWNEHGLQCGYCTPGMLMAALPLLDLDERPTDAEIRTQISGNLCRCTGYANIVRAIASATQRAHAERAPDG